MARRSIAVASLLILGIVAIWSRIPQSLISNLQSSISNPQYALRSTQSDFASGFIQADEVLISTEVSGRVQALYADEGDSVWAGQVLAQLDTAVLDARIQEAEAALRGTEAKLAEVKASADPWQIEIAEAGVALAEEGVAVAEKAVEMARGNVATAQATLQAAQAELARLRAGPDPYEVTLAEGQLEMAQERLPMLWAVRDSTGGSEERGELPAGSYEAAKAAVAQAEVQVRIARLQLEDLKAGARPEDLKVAQGAVEAAQAGVDAAKAQVAEARGQLEAARARLRQAQAHLELVKAGATREQVAMAQAQVSGARAALQALQVQRDKATLRAPRDGLILERTVHVGEMALSGGILFRLANLDRVKLTVYVPADQLGQVQLGQSVAVTVDSFPGRAFQGQVVHVASQAEFTPRNIQTKEERTSQVFAVKIELPNPDQALKPGMPADASFTTANPSAALRTGRGAQTTEMTAKRGRLSDQQSAVSGRPSFSGMIQSQADVVLSAEVGGRVVALGAEEGDEVEAGTVLVRLDEALVLAQMAQARAAVEGAEVHLVSVKAGARSQEVEAARAAVDAARAQVAAAQAAVDVSSAKLQAAGGRYRTAQARLARLLAGPSERELKIVEGQIELAKARSWAAQAQRDATRTGLHMPLSISLTWEDVELGPIVIANPVGPKQLDVEAAEAMILEADTAVNAARLHYDRLKAGSRAEVLAAMQAEVAKAQAEVQVAQVALERAQEAVSVARAQQRQTEAQLDLLLAGPRPEQVAVAETQVAQALAEVAILEARREKLSLRTPMAGVVSRRLVHEGEIVVAGARLFTISALDPVILTIYVPESQLGHVHLRQTAEVRVDAYPGRTFQGQVVYIASRAEFTPRNIQTREERATTVFAVRIRIPNPERLLKPGMPADATLR